MKGWTNAELEYVCDHYGVDRTVGQIACQLRRPLAALQQLIADCALQKPRNWSAAEDAWLRAGYGTTPTHALAAELGRSENAVGQRAGKLGLNAGRIWSDADAEVIRALYATHCPADIAERLGRPRKTAMHVMAKAFRMGLARHPHHPPAVRARIRRLHAQGLPDRVIAQRTGLTHDQVKHVRRVTLKLPTIPDVEGRRECVRKQCLTLGIPSVGGGLRAWAYRNFARESGWPEDLRPREVQVLNVLAAQGAPLTRFELAAAIGMRTDRMGANGTLALLASCNGPGGTYTASLIRKGLVIALRRAGPAVAGARKGGRRLDLYTLGPAALALLQERAKACQSTGQ